MMSQASPAPLVMNNTASGLPEAVNNTRRYFNNRNRI